MFETMIFGGSNNSQVWLCKPWVWRVVRVKSGGKRFGHTMISGDTMWSHSCTARIWTIDNWRFDQALFIPFAVREANNCLYPAVPIILGHYWFEPNSCSEKLQIPQASFQESKLYSYWFVHPTVEHCHSNQNMLLKNVIIRNKIAMILPSIAMY